MYYILYNLLFEKHFYQSHPQSKLENGRYKTGDQSFNTDIEIATHMCLKLLMTTMAHTLIQTEYTSVHQ